MSTHPPRIRRFQTLPLGTEPALPRKIALHPTLPFAAWVQQSTLVVSHLETRETLVSLSLSQLFSSLLRKNNNEKLGSVQSLAFYDWHTLYWNGMLPDVRPEKLYRWQTIVVQTSQRIFLWDLSLLSDDATRLEPQRIQAHLHEGTLHNTVPSSNVLPLTDKTILVGCNDGSLKIYNWKSDQVLKSIKGLGKGDFIVQLAAANPSNSFGTTSSGRRDNRRRILTVTQRGSAYLLELEIESLELHPPLCRFQGAPLPIEDTDMEHVAVTYHTHKDWVTWFLPKTGKNQSPAMMVWNLQALQSDLVQASGSKNLFQPEPTCTVTFPVTTTERATVLPLFNLTDFGDTTLVMALATANAQVHLLGAATTSSTASATLLRSVSLPQRLQLDAHLDVVPLLRVHGIVASSGRPGVVFATQLGFLVLDFEGTRGSHHFHTSTTSKSHKAGIIYGKDDGSISYGPLEILHPQPFGRLEYEKHSTVIYRSIPTAPGERRPQALPCFLPSPSGLYVAVMWPWEFRYDILHLPTIMQNIASRSGQSPLVASGHGVVDLCWVGDQDNVYAILKAPDWDQEDARWKAVNKEDAAFTLSSMAHITKSATKVGFKAATSATSAATKGVSLASKSTKVFTSSATKAVRTGTKGMKKSLVLFGLKGKKNRNEDSIADQTLDDTEAESFQSPMASQMPNPGSFRMTEDDPTKRRHVELRCLVAVESQASELTSSVAAATSSSLGSLTMRGGSRNPPTSIFGGPVLCVGSRSNEDLDGHAHFYTLKKGETGAKASSYVSSGPTLPYPNHVEWDEDGRICAIVVESRVMIYISNEPDFVLLGSVCVGPGTDPGSSITSVRFLHGALYCSTWNSVYCVFLGNVEVGLCQMDTILLASSEVRSIPAVDAILEYSSFTPPVIPLPIIQPVVLGYQSGSLLVSSVRGTHAIPLTHPVLRIGILLAAGQIERAIKWFDAIPDNDHDKLASFLERRGYPSLAFDLSGLSLEKLVDMCMRYGDLERLEDIVESFGVKGLRTIDMGYGFSQGIFGPEESTTSIVVAVGAYFLAHGNTEFTRRIASECIRHGVDGRKDALILASLLLAVNEADAMRLIQRAVEEGDIPDTWFVGRFARDFVLTERAKVKD